MVAFKFFYSSRFWLCFLAVLGGALVVAGRSDAQDLTKADPDQIAAECGGNAQAGAPHFAACSTCHALTADADPLQGPHLQGVFGRKVAAVEGFPYSGALLARGEAGLKWEREDLHAFLTDPNGHTPGLLMDHPKIEQEQARRDLLTYMRTASLAPPPAQGTMTLSDEVLGIEGDPAYGEYLAGECVTCHQPDKAGKGTPRITGMTHYDFVYAMHEYRLRARENAAMQMVAGALGDEEIAALAAYFAAPPQTVPGVKIGMN